jgi:glucose dehydrogenase
VIRFPHLATAGFLAVSLHGQGLDPALLLKAPTDTWPTYHGDYSGRRYSTLSQIDTSNVRDLTLAWVYRAVTDSAGTIYVTQIKSTPLEVNGILYFTVPTRSGR